MPVGSAVHMSSVAEPTVVLYKEVFPPPLPPISCPVAGQAAGRSEQGTLSGRSEGGCHEGA